jgi:acid phosphatase type 7
MTGGNFMFFKIIRKLGTLNMSKPLTCFIQMKKNNIISLICFLLIPVLHVPAREYYAATTEQPGGQQPFMITHGPYLQHLGETGVTIIWTTSGHGVSWVELAPDDGTHFYQSERPKYHAASHGLKNVSTVHRVRVGGLEPGTRYRYRVYSTEVVNYSGMKVEYGNTVASNVYRQLPLTFVTGDHSKEESAFVMLSDIHGNNEVMRQLLGLVDWDNTDMVFFNGDMYGHLESQQQLFDDFMDTAVEIFAGEIPLFYARGNHEARGVFAHNFSDYFPGPEGNLYYMFRQGPVSYLVFDSGEDKPDSDIEYHGIAVFDEYMEQQADWLRNAVNDEAFKSSDFKIAVIHIPPNHPWYGAGRIYENLVPVLNESGIDLMLCGHRHRVFVHEPAGGIDFPIVENGHNTLLHAETKQGRLILKIMDIEGSLVESIVIERSD